MYMMYGLLTLMMVSALGVLAIPFVMGNKIILAKDFFIIALSTTLLAFILYQSSSDHEALAHYQLQVQLEQLGGIDGVIARIKMKLQANPHDTQGWLILSKLYLIKHDYNAAKEALSKAHENES